MLVWVVVYVFSCFLLKIWYTIPISKWSAEIWCKGGDFMVETVLTCTKSVPFSFARSFKVDRNGVENKQLIRINSKRFCQILENGTVLYVEENDDKFIFASNTIFDLVSSSEESKVVIKFRE